MKKSHCHTFAVKQLIQYDHASTVNAQLNQQAADDQAVARRVRRVMISSVLYLARQGMPLRGHDGEDGKPVAETANPRYRDVKPLDARPLQAVY